jgi:hypothetical protein
MATTLDGQIVVLALCTPPSESFLVRPGLIVRQADGTWLPQETLSVDGRWGHLVLLGDGPDARAVALLASAQGRSGIILQKRLADPGPWQVQPIELVPSEGLYPATATFYLFRGLPFRRPDGSDGIVFTWAIYGGNAVHALTSLDGGRSWGPVETVAAYPTDPAEVVEAVEERPPDHRWAAPAYDVRTDRLVVILVRRDLAVPWPGNGTHYAFWSVPGSSTWHPRQVPAAYEQAIPLISGAISASWTDTAQMANASYVWLAWVDRARQLQVRSLDFSLIVPTEQQPTAPSTTGAR